MNMQVYIYIYIYIYGRVILRRIFRTWEGVVGSGWSGLRIGTVGGHL
jgi:ABC-type polysaccharide transport system permease subunit